MKKAISFILSIIIACSSLIVFADTSETVQPETEEIIVSSPYFKLFKNLGILSLEKEQKYISRIDFAEIIAKVYGSGELSSVDTIFNDVKSDDEKSGYVKFAFENGLIKGYSDANYRPYDNLTGYEAVATIVRTLGYEEQAELQGGFPSGYMNTAQRIRILKGAAFGDGNAPIELYKLLKIVYNSLSVSLMDMSAVTNEEIEYAPGNETLLSEKMNIYTLDGEITETYLTALSGKSNLDKGFVRIDKNVYKTELELLDDLGKTMTFYIRDTDSPDEVLGYLERENQEEIVIDDFQMISVSEQYINYYDENGRADKIRVSDSTDLIKNGCAKIEWSTNELMPQGTDSYIRILDSDADGCSDVIFLETYKNYTLKNIDIESCELFLKSANKSSIIVLDDLKRYTITEKDGSEIFFSDLVPGDLLSISESEDKSVYILHRCADKVTGTVNAVWSDQKKIELDGTWYNCTSEAYATLKTGDYATISLDFRGKLSCETDYMNDVQYGYFVKIGKEGSLSQNVSAKIFTADGEMKVFEFADKVKVNGGTKESAATAYDKLKSKEGQVITYECDADGKIRKFDTAVSGEGLSNDEKFRTFTKEAFIGDSGIYWRSSKVLGHKFRINSNTVIFDIPSDKTKEDEYKIMKDTELVTDQRYINVSVYDIDADYNVGAVSLGLTIGDKLHYTSPSGVITKIRVSVDEHGEELTKITLNSAGTVTDILIDPADVTLRSNTVITDATKDPAAQLGVMPETMDVGDLEIGDILQYVIFDSSTNKVKLARVMFRGNYPPSANGEYSNGSKSEWNVYTSLYTVYAKVKDVVDGALVVEIPFEGSTVERVLPVSSSDKIIRMSRDEKWSSSTTLGTVNPEDEIFMHIRYASNRLIVVYE